MEIETERGKYFLCGCFYPSRGGGILGKMGTKTNGIPDRKRKWLSLVPLLFLLEVAAVASLHGNRQNI